MPPSLRAEEIVGRWGLAAYHRDQDRTRACEKAVFASPEAVAAGIKHVTSQLALLDDGTTYAERGDASYAAELAPLRTALELDRFGIVAHVLGDQGCTPENCDALMRFHDSSKVLGNLRNRTFEEQVKKYTATWDRPAEGVAVGPEVGQKYDSPSPKSIPPVSIVAPEESPPREAMASESTDVTPQPAPQGPQPTPPLAGGEPTVQSAVVTPLPPRRPPQRPQPLRPAAPPQLPPIDLPGTPPPPPGLIR